MSTQSEVIRYAFPAFAPVASTYLPTDQNTSDNDITAMASTCSVRTAPGAVRANEANAVAPNEGCIE
ncbi:MAG TPA: hypothetical protein VNT79_11695 [Phycisphaerae bacterium]|nr:hypothetical protein [Phycisphaerae bacterium]